MMTGNKLDEARALFRTREALSAAVGCLIGPRPTNEKVREAIRHAHEAASFLKLISEERELL